MAATSGKAIPVHIYKVLVAGTAQGSERRIAEKATQTFLIGTPVNLSSGTVQATPTITGTAVPVAGFSSEPGNNLTTAGVAKTLTYGSVQNQPSAVLIPVGAPPNDGTMGIQVANDSNVFIGVFGDSATAALAVLAQSQVGSIFGLTKDAGNNYWYVDNNITAAGSGACCEITELVDAVGTLNGRVAFKITQAYRQLDI